MIQNVYPVPDFNTNVISLLTFIRLKTGFIYHETTIKFEYSNYGLLWKLIND